MIDRQQLVMYPPFVCRVIARRVERVDGKRKVMPISTDDLANRSGLTVRRVLWISAQSSWDSIPVGEMVRFLDGCELLGVPVWRMRWFLARSVGRSGSFSHLDRLPKSDRQRVSTFFEMNAKSWEEAVRRSQNA